jgi:pimeloyl-ACP methyl ester carboxylesterase
LIRKAESKYIVINHLRLHYLEWGEEGSRPMVLLHGSGDNAHVWDYFSCYASKYFRIIALDQRGHGNSDWPIPPAYELNDYVSDLIRLVETLQVNGIVLMGHSIGALHATAYAAMKPEKVSALIHIDIEPCPPSWNKKYLRRIYDTLPTLYDSVQDFVDQIQETSPFADKEMLFYLASFAVNKKEDDKFYARFDREVLSHFDQYDLRPHLSSIKCPTLILRGKESRVMRREKAQEMNRAILNSKLVEIPQATHPVHTDNPSTFRQIVLDFLCDCGFIERDR